MTFFKLRDIGTLIVSHSPLQYELGRRTQRCVKINSQTKCLIVIPPGTPSPNMGPNTILYLGAEHTTVLRGRTHYGT